MLDINIPPALPRRDSIMNALSRRLLQQAELAGQFDPQKTEIHFISNTEDSPTSYETTSCDYPSPASIPSPFSSWPTSPIADDGLETSKPVRGRFTCIFQRTRPHHVSGSPDKLPFKDADTLRHLFVGLHLPEAYLHIADGSPAVVQTMISHGHEDGDDGADADADADVIPDNAPVKCEFVAHCVSKQGDWALALTHDRRSRHVSAFWSVDGRIDSSRLLGELRSLQDHAFHPMLLPCIMFAETLRASVARRNAIKTRLKRLEDAILKLHRRASRLHDQDAEAYGWWAELPAEIDLLFDLLHACKKEQASREGRYEFWRSFHSAIQHGLDYAQDAMKALPRREFARVHSELRQWSALVWQKLESLKARDKDHVSRVADVSDMLYHVLRQRDNDIQCSIARASKRDNEDMKFIGVLGSVFLPASLVATIFNVPQFQFVYDAKLWYAYAGITLPLIALVVSICVARPRWRRWFQTRRKKALVVV